MRLVNKLNSNSIQRAYLTGNPGQRIILDLRYLPTQQIWMADLQLDSFEVKGIFVTVSPNLLHSFHNVIPFGLVVTTDDGQEPRGVDDFDTGYAKIFLMDQNEVLLIEAAYFD